MTTNVGDCPSCGHANRPEARFCGGCGAPLGDVRCPDCGTENPAGQRFCDGCGKELAVAAEAAPPADVPAASRPRSHTPEHLAAKIRAGAGALEGEHKQVTVLFADVVGSMELAARADLEAWRSIMESFFSLCCDAVHRYEGTVDKFTGDGAMAIFGAPIAHEDHARRACYAALELQASLAGHAAEVRREQGLELAVRIGLNSGEVVVGSIGEDLEMDYTAIGHTVGLAQRTEQLAEPGKAFLTEHTAGLVEGHLDLLDRGVFEPPGAGGPVRMYELAGPGGERKRVEVVRRRGFSRFVGREQEIGVLEDALEQALAGQGQVVGIVGEPGVGKSRLCHELAERCRARGIPVYHAAGQAHASSVSLMPVLQLLRDFFGIGERDSDRVARERIVARLASLDLDLGEELPLLFELLAVPDPERPAERMDPEARQRRLLALMRRLTHAQSAREPGVLVFEDLHWLDGASEAYLANHVEALPGTRGLAVVNFRPEYRVDWMSRSYYRQVALAPLGAEATERLLADLLGSGSSLDGLAELIATRTEGNPFFVEETVQALVEEGNLAGERGAYRLVRPVDGEAVPASVQAVLAARIDRLGERQKAVLGAASAIGREFAELVLRQVAGLAPEELEEALGDLVAGEFVYLQEVSPEPLYLFKHALTQQVAYRSQLEPRRRALHVAVAEAIAAHYPERLDEQAALLAGHWEAAGELLEAARWHARAGAHSGATDLAGAPPHWRRVRELADELPGSEEATALGIAARLALLGFGWRFGISREEVETLVREGEQMAARAGDTHSRALLLARRGSIETTGQGKIVEGTRLMREASALAEETGDPALYLTLTVHTLLPFGLIGEFRESIAIADRAIELADGDPGVGAGLSIACPYAFAHAMKGYALSYLGELDAAGREIARAREIAGEREDIEVVCWTHWFSCWRGSLRGEPEVAHDHARQGLAVAERIGDSFSRSHSWLFLGMAERMQGRREAAIEALERATAISREQRTALETEPLRLALLAESRLGLDDAERARKAAAESVDTARAQGNVRDELTANLAQARVLLATEGADGRAPIEAALARTLELVHRTGAKAFEPQVHVELAELARRSGDGEARLAELREAHRLFSEIGAGAHAERVAGELAAPAG